MTTKVIKKVINIICENPNLSNGAVLNQKIKFNKEKIDNKKIIILYFGKFLSKFFFKISNKHV